MQILVQIVIGILEIILGLAWFAFALAWGLLRATFHLFLWISVIEMASDWLTDD